MTGLEGVVCVGEVRSQNPEHKAVTENRKYLMTENQNILL